MAQQVSFETFRNMVLYHKVVEWNQERNYIILDNGIKITIAMTDSDCCAYASGQFENVQLDAAITEVTERECYPWDDGYTFGCSVIVKMLHNQNLVCAVNADADAGNGGYYYSIASFVVSLPDDSEVIHVTLADSEEGR